MVPVNANYVITSDQTVKDAILKISINLARCVIVTRDSSIVIGVVSEGDIVRALTDDISVYTSITKIMRPSFKYLNESSLECALKLVQEQPGITLIPVVTLRFELEEVVTIHDVMAYVSDILESN
jgi:CBS domain-containing protein